MMDVVSEAVRAGLIVLELFSPPPGDCNVQQVQYDGVVVLGVSTHCDCSALSPLPFNLELLTMQLLA